MRIDGGGEMEAGFSPKDTLELSIIVVNMSPKLQHVGTPLFTFSLLGTDRH